MGEIRFGKNLPTEFVRTAIRFLLKEHRGIIYERRLFCDDLIVRIEGDGIPQGRVSFALIHEELVPNVLIFKIWP